MFFTKYIKITYTMRKSDTNVKPSEVKKANSIVQDAKHPIFNKIEPPKGIENRITDYRNDKLGNLVYDHASTSFKNVNIYNNKIYYMQKIWIRTPVLKIFRPIYHPNDKIKNSIPLSLLLIDTIKDVESLIHFIKRLEMKVTKIIKTITNNPKMKLKSSIKTYEGFPPVLFINMPFNKINDQYEFTFNIYNKSNNRINIDSIKKGVETAVYMELSGIWYSDTHYGCVWNVMQMKIYPEIIFGTCLFEDEDDDNDFKDVILDKQECYHCLYCPSNHIRTSYSFSPPTQYAHVHSMPPLPPPPPPLYIPQRTDRDIREPIMPITTTKPAFTLSLSDLLSVKLKPVDNRVIDKKKSPLGIRSDSDTNRELDECKKNLK